MFLSRGTLGQSVRLPLSCLSGTTPRTVRRALKPNLALPGQRLFVLLKQSLGKTGFIRP